ncbi:MAG: ATP-binding cassette domain-containing protein [Alphaproteobacteria bacterium]|nr:ATP-binding cassette domain-containing protein [Alphaproteobacteria bacterium]
MRLVCESVGHKYGALDVLDGIGLTVADGECLAVVGPSGCGKSTLLGIMGGLVEPTAGRVFVEGAAPAGSLNPITYVFQDFALLPWRSVASNVALALEHHPLDAQVLAARVDDALARTGLREFRDAFPKQLSGGMRQRVGIARALAVAPAVLLMDEPLSALDAQTRELLMEDFLALWLAARTTSVYVTHNLHEALRLADRICVLSRRPGRIKQIVGVGVPQADRALPAAARAMAELAEQLWHAVRAEAVDAEREVADG